MLKCGALCVSQADREVSEPRRETGGWLFGKGNRLIGNGRHS